MKVELEIENDGQYINVIHKAAEKGSVKTLKLFAEYEKSKQLFDKKHIDKTQDGWITVLGFGAKSGNLDTVKFLIESKQCGNYRADDIVDSYENKAIMKAAESNNVKLMQYLIDKSRKSNDEMIHESNRLGQTPFFYTGTGNAVETMKFLLKNYKVDINMKDVHGKTTLMYAATNASMDALTYLISNYKSDLDINVQNNDGDTALTLAMKGKHEKCVEFLKMNGAK